MSQKRHQQSYDDSRGTGYAKRRALKPNLIESFSERRDYDPNTLSSNTSTTYGTPSLATLDFYDDTDMHSLGSLRLSNLSAENASVPLSSYQTSNSELALYDTHWRQDICFGMICDVEIQFPDKSFMFEGADFMNEIEDSTYCQLKIGFRDRFFVLQAPNRAEVGILNNAISRCLQELSGHVSIYYQAYIASSVWKEVIQSWKRAGKGGIFLVDINVYGSNDDTAAVRRVFSQARFYFQHPYHFDNSTKYENPHYLSFPNMTKLDSLVPTLSSTSVYETRNSSSHDISEIFRNLDQQEYIHEAEIDTHVKTPLLSHQKEGVYFIMQREAGIIPSPLSLWKLNQTLPNRSFYEHLITGTKRQVIPQNNLGGLISDEMGMGKSLTMLSAVVGTLLSAEIFARSVGNDAIAKGNQKLTTKATLIIVPSAMILDGWIDEVQMHILPNALRVHKYHGQKRELDTLKLLEFDVVLTTYAIVATEFRGSSNVLHKINWFRIVLDEAHAIRHESTSQFRAVLALSSKIRWCLTGTPIQNSLKDLAALVKFLRVPQLESGLAFREYITSPIESGASTGFSRLRLLLKSLCLRRTNELLGLSKPVTIIHRLDLTSAEDETYKAVGENYRQEIDKAVSGERFAQPYNGILQALLRLRLLCNHGTYEPSDSLSPDPEEALELLQQSDNARCAYCSCDVTIIEKAKDLQPAKFTVCNHLLCNECLPTYESELKERKMGRKAQCPLCENMITENFLASKEGGGRRDLSQSSVSPAPFSYFNMNEGFSTKLLILLQEIKNQNESDKSIVFSAWKKSLDLVACLLSARGIPFDTINGSLSLPERRRVLSNFKLKQDFKVLLMTLGTGAVGLNLTVANRIHILEPQWNPSIEKQAIGRILRLGQDREITIIRYIMNGTVEEYVESRQTRKLQLATLGWEQRGENEEDQKLKELLELRSLVLRTEAPA